MLNLACELLKSFKPAYPSYHCVFYIYRGHVILIDTYRRCLNGVIIILFHLMKLTHVPFHLFIYFAVCFVSYYGRFGTSWDTARKLLVLPCVPSLATSTLCCTYNFLTCVVTHRCTKQVIRNEKKKVCNYLITSCMRLLTI